MCEKHAKCFQIWKNGEGEQDKRDLGVPVGNACKLVTPLVAAAPPKTFTQYLPASRRIRLNLGECYSPWQELRTVRRQKLADCICMFHFGISLCQPPKPLRKAIALLCRRIGGLYQVRDEHETSFSGLNTGSILERFRVRSQRFRMTQEVLA